MKNENKIKLILITDALFFAGPDRQLLYIIEHINRKIFEPILCVLRPSKYYNYSDIPCKVIQLNVFKFISTSGFKSAIKFIHYLRRNKIDIIHTFYNDGSIFGAITGFLSRRPIIISSRRDCGYWMNNRTVLLYRVLDLLSTKLLVNAQCVKENVIIREKIRPHKIELIYNGVNPQSLRCDFKEVMILKKKLGIKDNEKVVGIIANFRPVKAINIFLKACHELTLKNNLIKFIIVGDGHKKEDLKKLAIKLNLNKKVIFAGSVKHISPFLGLFDIGVLSSKSEGLSNSILEYMACGLPVVATDVGGNSEVIKHNVNGFLVKPNDPYELATAIEKLLNNKNIRKTFSKNSKKIVKDKFSISSMIKNHELLYKNLYHHKMRFDSE